MSIVGTATGLGEELLGGIDLGGLNPFGGGDDEEVARQTQAALSCSGDADPDLARKALTAAQADPELRSLLSEYASTVNWAGGAPSTLEEQACGWSNHVAIDWPSPGSRTYDLRQEILRRVEEGATVESGTVGAKAPADGGGGGFGDDLLGILEEILRPGEIAERAEGAVQGAGAGARTGARTAGGFGSALPWILLGLVLLVGGVVVARS